MGTRLEFQTVLSSLQDGAFVYYQPPENVKMQFPAIVYNRDYQQVEFADNSPYFRKTRYQVMVIDSDPDSLIPDLVSNLPLSKAVRHFTTAGLNHDIFNVYF